MANTYTLPDYSSTSIPFPAAIFLGRPTGKAEGRMQNEKAA
jgi:hypothetical protein